MDSASPVRYFQFFTYRLAYRVLGDGPAALLAFHGFGQNGSIYTPLNHPVEKRYTIYAIDLFFHGESKFSDDAVLTKATWQSLLSAFLLAHQIDQFSLLGFSLGGRFALVTAELFINRLSQLVLIAPDGITRNAWYRLATTTSAGRWLFGFTLRHLSLFNNAGHFLIRIGLLHRTLMRFAEVSLATAEQRRQVYLSWTVFRTITTDLALLATTLNQKAVPVRFFTGYFDQIVPGHYVLPLTKRLHGYELTVLKTGHNRLIELVAHIL